MEIKISLNEYADVSFIKKLLSQIKDIKSIEISEDDKSYSWEEIENSDSFARVMEQSDVEYKTGKGQEMTDEFLDGIFDKK